MQIEVLVEGRRSGTDSVTAQEDHRESSHRVLTVPMSKTMQLSPTKEIDLKTIGLADNHL